MKFFVISDNIDTQIGMRLTGIEGVVVHEPDEVEQALRDAQMALPGAGKELGLVLHRLPGAGF